MKTIGKIKLNQLSKAEIEKRELCNMRGGQCCGCGCHYSGGGGGSSAQGNMSANWASGYGSYGGNIGCTTDGQNGNLPSC